MGLDPGFNNMGNGLVNGVDWVGLVDWAWWVMGFGLVLYGLDFESEWIINTRTNGVFSENARVIYVNIFKDYS